MTKERYPGSGSATVTSTIEYAPCAPGVRLVFGRDVTFAKSRTIVHADYSIKLTTKGQGAPIYYRGLDYEPCARGGVNVFDPFEPVVAKSSPGSTSFMSMLVEPELVSQASESLRGSGDPGPGTAYLNQFALARELGALGWDHLLGSSAEELETRAFSALELLLSVGGSSKTGHVGAPPISVRLVRELILDRLAENVPLDELERHSGFSRFYLVRLFRRYYGLPPHEFRIRARVAMARRLLANGHSQAETALAVGFFDQSHFHRHFQRIVGVSPGTFRQRLVSGKRR